nr:transposon Ty3-G Gag-Pol polyprotein [Tanacetum cinerariifolium]
MAINKVQGHGNQGNQERGREFMWGAEEARQDPNIMTDIESSDLGFSYEIEIASEQLVEIDKVIRRYKLEIEGHVFHINLIPFGSESFDLIMDWLSDHNAEIICHEKVVRIPLLDGKVLRVLGEKPKEEMRQLMSDKDNEKKQEEIVVVKDILEAPSELEELSGQLKELQDKDDILIYSKTREEHEMNLGLVLEFLKKEKLYAKFSKCEFWLREVQFLRHVINGNRIHVDPSEEQENAFQTLKDKLCNAPVLALPDRLKDFMVYCNASGLGLELFSDYDSEIHYHPGKANVVADAQSKKERVNPKRVRAMNMILQLSIKDMILAAQKEASNESVGLQEGHGVPISIISDRDSRFTSRFWQSMQEALGTRLDMSTAYHPQTDGQSERIIQTLEEMLRAYVLDFVGSWDVHLSLVEFSYNNSYHSSVRCVLFEALYGKKSVVRQFYGLRLGKKGVVRFGKKRKLAPRFVRPFEIIEKVSLVAYRLDLPEELDGVHDTFHMSNIKKCLAYPTLQVPLDKIQVDARLNFMEGPMEILEREFKKLERSRIAIVKVRWNSKCGPEFTWKRKDQMKLKYLHLFSADSS